MPTLQQLMQTPVLIEAFSQIRTPQSRFQKWFGFELMGGKRKRQIPGRYFSYDIYNKTRNIANFRAPGTPPSTRAANPINTLNGVFPRIAEEIRMPLEKIWNIRQIGGPRWDVDKGGLTYIQKQQETLKQIFENTREFMVSRMLRGNFQLLASGDDWLPVDSGGQMTIDFQIPAGNKSQLNMLGAGSIIDVSWDNPAADIFGHLTQVNAAFEQLHGYSLKHIWCTARMWNYVVNNTGIKALGGTSQTTFASYEYVPETGDDGLQQNAQVAVLRCIPWLQWHIYDGGLNVGATPTFTKLIPDDKVIMLPEPDQSWVEMLEGSEPVIERDGANPIYPYGFHPWMNQVAKPATVELDGIDNAIPALLIPTCVAYATAKF